MKHKIDIIIALVSILISCFFIPGCTPSPGYITVDARSELMHPRFCFYRDASLEERLDIKGFTVWKVQRSPEFVSQWDKIQMVWSLDYFQNQLTSPMRCLTYGVVPPGYQVDLKAVPLEPEQFYSVWIRGARGVDSEDQYFIIRVDENGTPKRLESH